MTEAELHALLRRLADQPHHQRSPLRPTSTRRDPALGGCEGDEGCSVACSSCPADSSPRGDRMSTNVERAALVMAENSLRRYGQDITGIPYLANRNLPSTQALADAGLLAPDHVDPEPPRPAKRGHISWGHIAIWDNRYGLGWDADGVIYDTTPDALRHEAACLLSAADYGEKHTTTNEVTGEANRQANREATGESTGEATGESDAPGISEESASESGNAQVGGALIIRDDDGLDTLDPDTLIIDWKGAIHRAATAFRLPCAVLATGDRVRAAEEALKELKHP